MNRLMTAPILLLLFAAPAFSQGVPTGGPPPVDRLANADRIRQQEMSRREWQLRNFGTEPGEAKDDRQLKAIMAQTEEDFTRILTLHNEIARALTSKKDLNYQFVSEATAEIKKRASRVQSTLGLHPASDDAPVKEIVRKVSSDNYRISSLILGIVNSEPFQKQRGESSR